MKRHFPFLAALILLAPSLARPADGELLNKARAYDAHYVKYHRPGLGGTVKVRFEDEALTIPLEYQGQGDSTIFTGMYLASQAQRYAVTGEEEAKQNAINAVQTLHHHLRITGRKGFVARYAAPAKPPFIPSREECKKIKMCRLVDGGTYDGYYYLGDTSRDQYDGYFYGMAIAYDLVDDEETRATIKADVREVIDALYKQGHNITDVDGIVTTAGPIYMSSSFMLGWYLTAAHIIDEQQYWDRYRRIADFYGPFSNLAYLEVRNHKYYDYYAIIFHFRNAYNIARLEPSPTARQRYVNSFKRLVWPSVKNTDNVFFDYVYMSITGEESPETIARDKHVLALMPEAPNEWVYRTIPKKRLDPYSVVLSVTRFFSKATREPRPIEEQCSTDFLWQRSPYKPRCQKFPDWNIVFPGVDYLSAYWMGRYQGYIGPED